MERNEASSGKEKEPWLCTSFIQNYKAVPSSNKLEMYNSRNGYIAYWRKKKMNVFCQFLFIVFYKEKGYVA